MMLVERLSTVGPEHRVMFDAWLERTSHVACPDNSGPSVISGALDNVDEASCIHANSVVQLLLASRRFDLNFKDASIRTSIAARLISVKSPVVALRIVSSLLEIDPLCIDLNARGVLEKAITRDNLYTYLTECKTRANEIWLPLLERSIEAHTGLPLVLCKLARQYLDGSGHTF
jgi:hypothetical protein